MFSPRKPRRITARTRLRSFRSIRDPAAIIPLPDSEINFDSLYAVLMQSDKIDAKGEDTITALDVRVSTEMQPIGPPGVPTGAAIYHVAVRSHGVVIEMYIDAVQGQIYQFQ